MSDQLKWSAAIVGIVGAAGLGACTATANSDSGSPKDVRVQHYNSGDRACLIFTHDTAQGASIAVDCVTATTSGGWHE